MSTPQTYQQAVALYSSLMREQDLEAIRALAREDVFFLLTVVLGREDAGREWVWERCRESKTLLNEHLQLWAREHYKSTIFTFALTIQDILRDPEITCGIFSHTRPIAKGFLAQIKREFESNELLKSLFPDILYADPAKESPRWSMDDGIVVKRNTNPKESTLEAWGLVDGQPIGKHFRQMVYDDVVTKESVGTPEQIAKTTEAWELSLSLGTDGGRRRYVGTRYHQADTYAEMIKRGIPAVIHAATDDGTPNGNPVLLSRETLDEKLRLMGPYTFSCQLLLNPVAVGSMGFRPEWLCYYTRQPNREDLNVYITVDPASGRKALSSKKVKNDYTAIKVVGLARDGNYYLLDGVRDRMSLDERTACLFRLVEKWTPSVVGYEKYGLQADIEHIRFMMEQRNYRFSLVELGGAVSKQDRILRLVPIFKANRMWFPARLVFVDVEGCARDLVREFVDDEYSMFPVCMHDDMLDALARILDPQLGASFPKRTQDFPFAVRRPNHARTNNAYDYVRGCALQPA